MPPFGSAVGALLFELLLEHDTRPTSLTLALSKLDSIFKQLKTDFPIFGQVLGIRVVPGGISLDF